MGTIVMQEKFLYKAVCPTPGCGENVTTAFTIPELRRQLQNSRIEIFCFSCNHGWLISDQERRTLALQIS